LGALGPQKKRFAQLARAGESCIAAPFPAFRAVVLSLFLLLAVPALLKGQTPPPANAAYVPTVHRLAWLNNTIYH
jgi:hypothetical protein